MELNCRHWRRIRSGWSGAFCASCFRLELKKLCALVFGELRAVTLGKEHSSCHYHRWTSIWGARSCVIERLSRVGAGWEASMVYRITLTVSMRFIVLRLMILALGAGLVLLAFVKHFGRIENNLIKVMPGDLS
jgi:hypothetical protein